MNGDPEADVLSTAAAVSAHELSEAVLAEMQRVLRERHSSLAAQKLRAEILLSLSESRAWLVRPDAPHGR